MDQISSENTDFQQPYYHIIKTKSYYCTQFALYLELQKIYICKQFQY